MRRFVVTSFSLLLLASVAAGAASAAPATLDGTLVVKNGTAPQGVPVVTLVIDGSAIGRVSGFGKIIIDDLTPTDSYSPEVTGADWHRDRSDTATMWGGTGLRFRAVGGLYRITIYGSGVTLIAIGHGNAWLNGQSGLQDGQYSLNGADFRSLPDTSIDPNLPTGASAASGRLTIGSTLNG